MPSTFSQILLHFVFSTKHREPLIDPSWQPRLYEYMGGIEDHVHLLVRWKTDDSIANLMRAVKGHASKWVNTTRSPRSHFRWQEAYGVFSVSQSNKNEVVHYIQNQAEHHRARPFADELFAMLRLHEIQFDERYVLD